MKNSYAFTYLEVRKDACSSPLVSIKLSISETIVSKLLHYLFSKRNMNKKANIQAEKNTVILNIVNRFLETDFK